MNRSTVFHPVALNDGTLFEALEARSLLSSYIYQDFGSLLGPSAPRVLAEGYRGPAVFVGDLDHDGVPDLLVGNEGVVTSGPNPGDSSGAAVFSGATGHLIRAHTRAEVRFGWYVAPLGDVDGDGAADYAIGCGVDTGASAAFVFSGATGGLLLTLTGNAPTGGATVAGVGDLNHDGRADILVGYVGENRAVVYSGANGSVLHQYSGDTGQQVALLGLGVGGGTDFNADGTPDFVIAGHQGTHAGNEDDPFHVPVYVYSGADGALLRTIGSFQNIPDGSTVALALTFDLRGDFNGDGVNEILFGSGNFAVALDATTGDQLFAIHPAEDGSVRSAVAIGDIDGDGAPDFAVGVPNALGADSSGDHAGRVEIYSGSISVAGNAFPRLSVLSDSRFSSARARIGASLAYGADLDGDGLPDLVAVGDQNVGGDGNGAGRVYAFSGISLIPPIPQGFAADASGHLVAWGVIRDHGYLVRDNTLTLVSALSGFAPTDHIIAYGVTTNGAYLLGAPGAGGRDPFLWRSGSSFNNGVRTGIITFMEIGGPAGTYTNLDGAAVNGAGQVLVQRVRNGSIATVWLYSATAHSMTYLFDGSPLGINAFGHVIGVGNDAATGMLWTPTALTPISGFSPTAFNDNDVIAGQAQRAGDAAPRPYTWSAGVFTPLPLISGGQDFVALSINNSGIVVGSYRVSATFAIALFIYDPAAGTTSEVRTLTDAGASPVFTSATSFFLNGINNSGVILASVPGRGTTFTLTPYSAVGGPYTVGPNSVISSTALPNGGVFVVTTNAAGEVLAYFRSPLSSPWQYVDLASAAGAPRLTGDAVAWYDPQEQLTYVAAESSAGLLLISQSNDGSWLIRNLTTEAPGSTAIVDSLVVLQPQSGLTILGGLDTVGDLVIYGQTAQTNAQARVVWAYDNLFNSVVRAAGLPVPDFNTAQRGRLIAYTTPWDGLNIVGSGPGGQPIALWNAPGIVGWRVSNLSDATTNPLGHSGFTHLTVYIASWGGINIASGSNVNVLWWAPGLGGEWRTDSLRTVANGPQLRANTLSAYFTPWGALNVAGLDELNKLTIYWWTPANDQWFVSPISASLPGGPPTPTGNVSSLVTPEGAINVFARSAAGDLLAYFWQPGASDWTVTDVTLTGTAAQ